jgi:polysaccharide pyruvyl transferase WcaK-like protein
MKPEAWDVSSVLPKVGSDGTLGFNISPLVHKILKQRSVEAAEKLEASVCDFLRDVRGRTGLGVLLVPHVDSVDGGTNNSDYAYMHALLTRPDMKDDRITLAPRDLNAAQTKHLISHCRYFIGARTHATIAAWSTAVPTISLGYSVKARGLNRDLFGDERYVLDTKAITRETLWTAFERLMADDEAVRTRLRSAMPEWRTRALQALPKSMSAGLDTETPRRSAT